MKDLIDDCEDKGTVNLDDKTYYLNGGNETHIVLNKTITVQGIEDKTIIDGNNTSLILDVNESDDEDGDDDIIKVGMWPEGYEFKYLGKNITFKNITFKDIEITTWHEMTFENCKFMNSTFTSYEYKNTFINCSFYKSIIEPVLFYGYGDIYQDYSRIINCSLCESEVRVKGVHTSGYIELIGGDQFRIVNRLEIRNSMFSNSNITLYRCNVTIDNSSFNNLYLRGSSDIFNITNTDISNSKADFSYSVISLYKSNLTNPKLHFSAGYFSNGCKVTMDSINLINCKMDSSISYGSRKGSLKIQDSLIIDSSLETTYSDVLINSSMFDNSTIEFFFSDANITNSTFINDANITDTIKTKNYNEVYTYYENRNATMEIEECQVKTSYITDESYLINGTGKYQIRDEDINMDTTHRLTVNETKAYYFNDQLIIKVENHLGEPVSGLELFIEDLNEYVYPTPSAKTDENGIAKYTLDKLGNVSFNIYYVTDSISYHKVSYGIILNMTINPTISGIKVSKVNFKSNTYSQIKSGLEIKTIAKPDANLKGLKFAYKVYTNGKAKTYYSKTDSNGKTTFKLPKALTAGKHKVEITLVNTKIKKTITVKIAKAKTTVKAPKVTRKFKKSGYFKITLKNKATKKLISNVKVKVKVYTGKKYKTYTVKTNKKGTAKINTKKLKKGKHKVVISSGNGNYKISAKSTIIIR